MAYENIKMIVADIDGTITWQNHHDIDDYTRKVIRRLNEKGILFGIATGRSVEFQIIDQYKRWGLDRQFDIVIGNNGAEFYDNSDGEHKYLCKLSKENIKEITELMMPFGFVRTMYRNGKRYINKADPGMNMGFKLVGLENYLAREEEYYEEDNPKIMYIVPAEQMAEVEAYVAKHPSNEYSAVKTQPTMLEFNNRIADKSLSLKYICEKHHIDLKDVMAFGDMDNDNGMLQTAGVGVALSSGGEATKKIADAITDYSVQEDGMARFIADYVLKEVI